MMKLKRVNMRKINWKQTMGLAVFFIQFLAGLYLFFYELQASCIILNGPVCAGTLDSIFYHYFKLAFVFPVVALSFMFSFLGMATRWDFSFEAEVLEVFIFICWLVLGYIYLFVNV